MIHVQKGAVERVEQPTTMTELHISVVGAIDEIGAAAWDASYSVKGQVNLAGHPCEGHAWRYLALPATRALPHAPPALEATPSQREGIPQWHETLPTPCC